MKTSVFVILSLMVIGAFTGIAAALNPFTVPDDFSQWPDETAPTRTSGLNPFTVPEGFNAWPDVTAPTRIPGLNPFGHSDMVIPTPAGDKDYNPGIRWERPARTEWINQTSITSGISGLTPPINSRSIISGRLSQLL